MDRESLDEYIQKPQQRLSSDLRYVCHNGDIYRLIDDRLDIVTFPSSDEKYKYYEKLLKTQYDMSFSIYTE